MFNNNPYAMNSKDPGIVAMMQELLRKQGGGQQGGQINGMRNPEMMQQQGQQMLGQQQPERPLTSMGNMLGGAALMGMGNQMNKGKQLEGMAPQMQGPMPDGSSLSADAMQRAKMMQSNPFSSLMRSMFG